MADEMKSVNLLFNEFDEKGLYLVFPDQSRTAITQEKVEQVTAQFLEDPAQVSPSVKEAIDYQACSICPKRGTGEFCHALHPTLSFFETIDRFVSSDKVVAVFRGKSNELLHVSNTTMQKALQFVSVLSLIRYCEVGRKYARYFLGVTPLMELTEVAERIYLNIYWSWRGNAQKIEEIITKFSAEIKITSSCQIKRLNTICKNDSFLSAFAITQAVIDLVSLLDDKALEKSFTDFEKE